MVLVLLVLLVLLLVLLVLLLVLLVIGPKRRRSGSPWIIWVGIFWVGTERNSALRKICCMSSQGVPIHHMH
jgi:hypothetical protein